MLSQKFRDLGIDVAFVREAGFDELVENNINKNHSLFFSSYGKDSWKTLRKIMHSSWNDKFNKCVDFQKNNNRKPSPFSNDDNERDIGMWLRNQEEITRRCGKCSKVVNRETVICPYCGNHTV